VETICFGILKRTSGHLPDASDLLGLRPVCFYTVASDRRRTHFVSRRRNLLGAGTGNFFLAHEGRWQWRRFWKKALDYMQQLMAGFGRLTKVYVRGCFGCEGWMKEEELVLLS